MMLYKVTSVAFDPDARTAYYTEDNYAFRDLMAVNVDTGRKRMLLEMRASATSSSTRPTSRSGASATKTASRPSSGSRRPMRASIKSTRSNTDRFRSTSISRRTANCFPPHSGRSTARRRSASGSSTSSIPTRSGRRREARPSALDARRLRLRSGRQVALRHVLLHRRIEHLSLRHRQPEIRRGQQCLDRLFPSDPAARRFAHRL